MGAVVTHTMAGPWVPPAGGCTTWQQPVWPASPPPPLSQLMAMVATTGVSCGPREEIAKLAVNLKRLPSASQTGSPSGSMMPNSVYY